VRQLLNNDAWLVVVSLRLDLADSCGCVWGHMILGVSSVIAIEGRPERFLHVSLAS